MSSIIALLPENVANQIAAGEVVQRPASVVKELLENAIDAGATHIKLIVKDAGRTLIQVIDNGSGMSLTDAHLCFERHATSKLKSADDLFQLVTKGFRGEALASIAAIAQVELKTRQATQSVGQLLNIEGGKFTEESECQCTVGSSFSVKNLFFNIPARRNFLKDDAVELKHIIDEFERVALPHPTIAFTFHSNGNELFNLPAGQLMQRLTGLFGNSLSSKLVTIKEETPFLKVSGYIGRPEVAKKRRGSQYFFVNNRFIKNAYLNHCIYEAYRELMSSDSHPAYYIFLELDPKTIDINIHPTKTEIKFTDDRTIYALLLSTVKRALGKAGAGPSLEFNTESSFNDTYFPSDKIPVQPSIQVDTNYNPFKATSPNYKPQETSLQVSNQKNWERLFDGFKKEEEQGTSQSHALNQEAVHDLKTQAEAYTVIQFLNKFLITYTNESVLIIDQQRAHERVLYEHYLLATTQKPVATQQLLFPEHVELSTNDFLLIEKLLSEFKALGFDVELFGKNNIVVNGTPADLSEFNVQQMIEGILETYKLNIIDVKLDKHDNLCRALAKSVSIKNGKFLSEQEMKLLVNNLLQCENPLYTANGKVVIMEVEKEQIDKFFKR
jgi:DNA mismatch repair protein MutL